MKLKNKKTGEIVEATDFNIISEYNSLAELNEDWEDMPEEEMDVDLFQELIFDKKKRENG